LVEQAINGWNARWVVLAFAELAKITCHRLPTWSVRNSNIAMALLIRPTTRLAARRPFPPIAPLGINTGCVAKLFVARDDFFLGAVLAQYPAVMWIYFDHSVAALCTTTTTGSAAAPLHPGAPNAIL
jgi:hypothetical protein